MNKYIWLIGCCMFFASSCTKTEDEKAAQLLSQIRVLYEQKEYRQTLDSITSLRNRFPNALKSRKEALAIWQNASLKQAQADIAKTDSALQATLMEIPKVRDRYKANMMRVRRDSLQARYEAMCGVVRMIHMRQKQN